MIIGLVFMHKFVVDDIGFDLVFHIGVLVCGYFFLRVSITIGFDIEVFVWSYF